MITWETDYMGNVTLSNGEESVYFQRQDEIEAFYCNFGIPREEESGVIENDFMGYF